MTPDPDSSMRKRSIRSFVKRTGRMTQSQRHALDQYWSHYGVPFQPDRLLDLHEMFPRSDCFKLEIGFGNGESLVQMAQQDSGCSYLGIEVHEPGVGHGLNRIHQLDLVNVRLISHDAMEVLEHMIPSQSLDAVFLFFPDPWHKKRHHKRRIVNSRFRDLVAGVMKRGAVLHMATDWVDYAEHMAQQLLGDPRFDNLGNAQGFIEKPDYRPQTKFERRGIRLGHDVRDLVFRRK